MAAEEGNRKSVVRRDESYNEHNGLINDGRLDQTIRLIIYWENENDDYDFMFLLQLSLSIACLSHTRGSEYQEQVTDTDWRLWYPIITVIIKCHDMSHTALCM